MEGVSALSWLGGGLRILGMGLIVCLVSPLTAGSEEKRLPAGFEASGMHERGRKEADAQAFDPLEGNCSLFPVPDARNLWMAPGIEKHRNQAKSPSIYESERYRELREVNNLLEQLESAKIKARSDLPKRFERLKVAELAQLDDESLLNYSLFLRTSLTSKEDPQWGRAQQVHEIIRDRTLSARWDDPDSQKKLLIYLGPIRHDPRTGTRANGGFPMMSWWISFFANSKQLSDAHRAVRGEKFATIDESHMSFRSKVTRTLGETRSPPSYFELTLLHQLALLRLEQRNYQGFLVGASKTSKEDRERLNHAMATDLVHEARALCRDPEKGRRHRQTIDRLHRLFGSFPNGATPSGVPAALRTWILEDDELQAKLERALNVLSHGATDPLTRGAMIHLSTLLRSTMESLAQMPFRPSISQLVVQNLKRDLDQFLAWNQSFRDLEEARAGKKSLELEKAIRLAESLGMKNAEGKTESPKEGVNRLARTLLTHLQNSKAAYAAEAKRSSEAFTKGLPSNAESAKMWERLRDHRQNAAVFHALVEAAGLSVGREELEKALSPTDLQEPAYRLAELRKLYESGSRRHCKSAAPIAGAPSPPQKVESTQVLNAQLFALAESLDTYTPELMSLVDTILDREGGRPYRDIPLTKLNNDQKDAIRAYFTSGVDASGETQDSAKGVALALLMGAVENEKGITPKAIQCAPTTGEDPMGRLQDLVLARAGILGGAWGRLQRLEGLRRLLKSNGRELSQDEIEKLKKYGEPEFDKVHELMSRLAFEYPKSLRSVGVDPAIANVSLQNPGGLEIIPHVHFEVEIGASKQKQEIAALNRFIDAMNRVAVQKTVDSVVNRVKGVADTRETLFKAFDNLYREHGDPPRTLTQVFCGAGGCSKSQLESAPSLQEIGAVLRLLRHYELAYNNSTPLPEKRSPSSLTLPSEKKEAKTKDDKLIADIRAMSLKIAEVNDLAKMIRMATDTDEANEVPPESRRKLWLPVLADLRRQRAELNDQLKDDLESQTGKRSVLLLLHQSILEAEQRLDAYVNTQRLLHDPGSSKNDRFALSGETATVVSGHERRSNPGGLKLSPFGKANVSYYRGGRRAATLERVDPLLLASPHAETSVGFLWSHLIADKVAAFDWVMKTYDQRQKGKAVHLFSDGIFRFHDFQKLGYLKNNAALLDKLYSGQDSGNYRAEDYFMLHYRAADQTYNTLPGMKTLPGNSWLPMDARYWSQAVQETFGRKIASHQLPDNWGRTEILLLHKKAREHFDPGLNANQIIVDFPEAPEATRKTANKIQEDVRALIAQHKIGSSEDARFEPVRAELRKLSEDDQGFSDLLTYFIPFPPGNLAMQLVLASRLPPHLLTCLAKFGETSWLSEAKAIPAKLIVKEWTAFYVGERTKETAEDREACRGLLVRVGLAKQELAQRLNPFPSGKEAAKTDPSISTDAMIANLFTRSFQKNVAPALNSHLKTVEKLKLISQKLDFAGFQDELNGKYRELSRRARLEAFEKEKEIEGKISARKWSITPHKFEKNERGFRDDISALKQNTEMKVLEFKNQEKQQFRDALPKIRAILSVEAAYLKAVLANKAGPISSIDLTKLQSVGPGASAALVKLSDSEKKAVVGLLHEALISNLGDVEREIARVNSLQGEASDIAGAGGVTSPSLERAAAKAMAPEARAELIKEEFRRHEELQAFLLERDTPTVLSRASLGKLACLPPFLYDTLVFLTKQKFWENGPREQVARLILDPLPGPILSLATRRYGHEFTKHLITKANNNETRLMVDKAPWPVSEIIARSGGNSPETVRAEAYELLKQEFALVRAQVRDSKSADTVKDLIKEVEAKFAQPPEPIPCDSPLGTVLPRHGNPRIEALALLIAVLEEGGDGSTGGEAKDLERAKGGLGRFDLSQLIYDKHKEDTLLKKLADTNQSHKLKSLAHNLGVLRENGKSLTARARFGLAGFTAEESTRLKELLPLLRQHYKDRKLDNRPEDAYHAIIQMGSADLSAGLSDLFSGPIADFAATDASKTRKMRQDLVTALAAGKNIMEDPVLKDSLDTLHKAELARDAELTQKAIATLKTGQSLDDLTRGIVSFRVLAHLLAGLRQEAAETFLEKYVKDKVEKEKQNPKVVLEELEGLQNSLFGLTEGFDEGGLKKHADASRTLRNIYGQRPKEKEQKATKAKSQDKSALFNPFLTEQLHHLSGVFLRLRDRWRETPFPALTRDEKEQYISAKLATTGLDDRARQFLNELVGEESNGKQERERIERLTQLVERFAKEEIDRRLKEKRSPKSGKASHKEQLAAVTTEVTGELSLVIESLEYPDSSLETLSRWLKSESTERILEARRKHGGLGIGIGMELGHPPFQSNGFPLGTYTLTMRSALLAKLAALKNGPSAVSSAPGKAGAKAKAGEPREELSTQTWTERSLRDRAFGHYLDAYVLGEVKKGKHPEKALGNLLERLKQVAESGLKTESELSEKDRALRFLYSSLLEKQREILDLDSFTPLGKRLAASNLLERVTSLQKAQALGSAGHVLIDIEVQKQKQRQQWAANLAPKEAFRYEVAGQDNEQFSKAACLEWMKLGQSREKRASEKSASMQAYLANHPDLKKWTDKTFDLQKVEVEMQEKAFKLNTELHFLTLKLKEFTDGEKDINEMTSLDRSKKQSLLQSIAERRLEYQGKVAKNQSDRQILLSQFDSLSNDAYRAGTRLKDLTEQIRRSLSTAPFLIEIGRRLEVAINSLPLESHEPVINELKWVKRRIEVRAAHESLPEILTSGEIKDTVGRLAEGLKATKQEGTLAKVQELVTDAHQELDEFALADLRKFVEEKAKAKHKDRALDKGFIRLLASEMERYCEALQSGDLLGRVFANRRVVDWGKEALYLDFLERLKGTRPPVSKAALDEIIEAARKDEAGNLKRRHDALSELAQWGIEPGADGRLSWSKLTAHKAPSLQAIVDRLNGIRDSLPEQEPQLGDRLLKQLKSRWTLEKFRPSFEFGKSFFAAHDSPQAGSRTTPFKSLDPARADELQTEIKGKYDRLVKKIGETVPKIVKGMQEKYDQRWVNYGRNDEGDFFREAQEIEALFLGLEPYGSLKLDPRGGNNPIELKTLLSTQRYAWDHVVLMAANDAHEVIQKNISAGNWDNLAGIAATLAGGGIAAWGLKGVVMQAVKSAAFGVNLHFWGGTLQTEIFRLAWPGEEHSYNFHENPYAAAKAAASFGGGSLGGAAVVKGGQWILGRGVGNWLANGTGYWSKLYQRNSALIDAGAMTLAHAAGLGGSTFATELAFGASVWNASKRAITNAFYSLGTERIVAGGLGATALQRFGIAEGILVLLNGGLTTLDWLGHDSVRAREKQTKKILDLRADGASDEEIAKAEELLRKGEYLTTMGKAAIHELLGPSLFFARSAARHGLPGEIRNALLNVNATRTYDQVLQRYGFNPETGEPRELTRGERLFNFLIGGDPHKAMSEAVWLMTVADLQAIRSRSLPPDVVATGQPHQAGASPPPSTSTALVPVTPQGPGAIVPTAPAGTRVAGSATPPRAPPTLHGENQRLLTRIAAILSMSSERLGKVLSVTEDKVAGRSLAEMRETLLREAERQIVRELDSPLGLYIQSVEPLARERLLAELARVNEHGFLRSRPEEVRESMERGSEMGTVVAVAAARAMQLRDEDIPRFVRFMQVYQLPQDGPARTLEQYWQFLQRQFLLMANDAGRVHLLTSGVLDMPSLRYIYSDRPEEIANVGPALRSAMLEATQDLENADRNLLPFQRHWWIYGEFRVHELIDRAGNLNMPILRLAAADSGVHVDVLVRAVREVGRGNVRLFELMLRLQRLREARQRADEQREMVALPADPNVTARFFTGMDGSTNRGSFLARLVQMNRAGSMFLHPDRHNLSETSAHLFKFWGKILAYLELEPGESPEIIHRVTLALGEAMSPYAVLRVNVNSPTLDQDIAQSRQQLLGLLRGDPGSMNAASLQHIPRIRDALVLIVERAYSRIGTAEARQNHEASPRSLLIE